MTRRGFNTLKLERNAARAPIWAPRAGVPLQLALEWSEVPFHGEAFLVSGLTGTLGPADLLVFTRACTLYLARRPSDRRIEVNLGEVVRWMGNATIGGSQRRQATACLARLRGASFTSHLRFGVKGSEQLIRGWGLIDGWLMPEGGRHVGWIQINATMAELLERDSVVLLDADTLEELVRRSPLAARLWVFLESESLSERGLTASGQPYPIFGSRLGEPARDLARAAITDMCRLTDPRRRRTVQLLRHACEVIEEEDTRYRLAIKPSAKGREGMWNLLARRSNTQVPKGRRHLVAELGDVRPQSVGDAIALRPERATWGTDAGNLGDATGALQGTEAGNLGDGAGQDGTPPSGRSVHGTRAYEGTDRTGPDVLLQAGLQVGSLQTVPVLAHRTGTRLRTNAHDKRDRERSAGIARDRAILADPDAPDWKREAAAAHLSSLGEGR